MSVCARGAEVAIFFTAATVSGLKLQGSWSKGDTHAFGSLRAASLLTTRFDRSKPTTLPREFSSHRSLARLAVAAVSATSALLIEAYYDHCVNRAYVARAGTADVAF